ncbi:hypothetical protein TKK_0018744 [Trichogramma kaykai]
MEINRNIRPKLGMIAKRLSLKAQDSAEEFGNEVEQLREAVSRSDEEKQRLETELAQVKEMLQREVSRAETDAKRNSTIIVEYKQICQRLEDDYNTAKASLNDLRMKISKCEKCACHTDETDNASSNSSSDSASRADPVLSRAQERVRELELELAQTKLAHVEAQCNNQDLEHQLHAVQAELQAARNSWLSKTLSSIKEATNKRDQQQSSQQQSGGAAQAPGNSLINANFLRRDSAPVGNDLRLGGHHQGFKEAI